MAEPRSSSLIEVGYVARPHGVRGELRAIHYDPESDALLSVPQVTIAGRAYEVESARASKGAVLLRLAGVRDRNQVIDMRGQAIAVERDQLALEDGEYFLSDLVGCEAVLEDGTDFGVVAAIETGPQDRLVIHHGDHERLLPLVPEFVVDIDLDAARIVVAPPEGLPESRRR